MSEDKIRACDLAVKLIELLDTIDDETFVDEICGYVGDNDYFTIELMRKELEA